MEYPNFNIPKTTQSSTESAILHLTLFMGFSPKFRAIFPHLVANVKLLVLNAMEITAISAFSTVIFAMMGYYTTKTVISAFWLGF
jgi:hypothetical protein